MQPAVDIPELLGLIGEVQNIYVDDLIYNYISELVEATRTQENIQLGLSPRAALAVCRSAKACAFIKGRDYVIPADVLEIFAPVCVHRLLLPAKARLHEQSAGVCLKRTDRTDSGTGDKGVSDSMRKTKDQRNDQLDICAGGTWNSCIFS